MQEMLQYVRRASNKEFCCWSYSDRVTYVAGVAEINRSAAGVAHKLLALLLEWSQINKYAVGVAWINRSVAGVAQINC
jgi:hypothetical protein